MEEELMKHIASGCRYGQPDGPDDYITDCDCPEEDGEEATKNDC